MDFEKLEGCSIEQIHKTAVGWQQLNCEYIALMLDCYARGKFGNKRWAEYCERRKIEKQHLLFINRAGGGVLEGSPCN
jgi:hypothetical protein